MDPFTHVLSGAVANRAVAPRFSTRHSFSAGERMLLGGAAALFPDIDWIIRLFADELVYLNLHRGITHSLIMLPLWALVLGWLVSRLWPGQRDWRDGAQIIGISIALHILLDFITSYGTQLFAPLSGVPLAFPSTFIIDPWVSLLLLGGLVLAWRGNRARPAAISLGLVTVLLLFQGGMKLNALEHAQRAAMERGLVGARVHALPQPLSPLHWRLVIETERGPLEAHLGFLRRPAEPVPDAGMLRRHWQVFRPPEALRWRLYPRFGTAEEAAFAREAWARPEFEDFRRFAGLPYLWAIRGEGVERCAIFTDLRFRTEGLPTPPFRFAMCRDEDGEWRRERVGNW